MHINTVWVVVGLVSSVLAQVDQQPTAERRVAQNGNGKFFSVVCGITFTLPGLEHEHNSLFQSVSLGNVTDIVPVVQMSKSKVCYLTIIHSNSICAAKIKLCSSFLRLICH